jgi:hypothetical protein
LDHLEGRSKQCTGIDQLDDCFLQSLLKVLVLASGRAPPESGSISFLNGWRKLGVRVSFLGKASFIERQGSQEVIPSAFLLILGE